MKIKASHVKQVVRKTWDLYFQFEKSQSPVDQEIYMSQRRLAENAIQAAPSLKLKKEWTEEFPLP